MDRASGWYKVHAQRIAFVIGLVLAVLLNVDTIHVGKQLWENEDLRAAAVGAAGAYLAGDEGQEQLGAFCVAEATGAPAATGGADMELDQATWEKVRVCTERESQAVLTALGDVGYPIGWISGENGLPGLQPGQTSMIEAAIGILITALALSLGASFWFDLLGRFMKVRMTGKREATAGSGPPSNGSS